MSELNIISAVLGPVATNCYTVHHVQTKDAVIIDPAESGEHIVKMIEEQGLILRAILLTHGHFDHCMAVPRLKKEYPEIREKLWKEAFWSQSYCLLTAGGAPIEVIREYIETQGEKR